MSVLLVHELHEARDRILLLKQRLVEARERELPSYRTVLEDKIHALDDALIRASIPESYKVAVVGRFKVGKSAFVNKLLGETLAGVDTSPETAAISIFRFGENTRAEIEFISKEDWDRLAQDHHEDPTNPELKRYAQFITFNERAPRRDKDGKEIEREKFDLDDLTSKWVTAGGMCHTIAANRWETKEGQREFRAEIRKFTSSSKPYHYLVNKLTIYAPTPILRDNIELIDTPGLDDTERFRVLLTEELVREVDAILFLTTSGASYSQSDKEFIVRQLRLRQIKHLQLIVTKCDETYANAVDDARSNDDREPSYDEFCAMEISRVKSEARTTLKELLQSNQLTEEEGRYFTSQLDEVPVHLVSKKYHEEGDTEKGGIESVRNGLYTVLSRSHRFEQSRKILNEELSNVINRLKDSISERSATLEKEFDPERVKGEISTFSDHLNSQLKEYGDYLGESRCLLEKDQEAFFHVLPAYLENIEYLAREVLSNIEKDDLVKHWKTRRSRRWGYLEDLQAKIADAVFPKVESILNRLCIDLDNFMKSAAGKLTELQGVLDNWEEEHQLTGLPPMALSATLSPIMNSLRENFRGDIKIVRDGIVLSLDAFISAEVQDRLENARAEVSEIMGKGTTIKQANEVSSFYREVRVLLAEALRRHVNGRVQDFSLAIRKSAESVGPRIREASEQVIRQRLKAIETTLQIERDGKKLEVAAFLEEFSRMLTNFAAESSAIAYTVETFAAEGTESTEASSANERICAQIEPVEQHYEIKDGDTGYTYERIFRPYIDESEIIIVEDPHIRLPYQVDNLTRFCALAVRLGKVISIRLTTGSRDSNSDDIDSRLETLKRDLLSRKITFTWERQDTLHDREIRFSSGWVVKIGRGLDIYHKPENWLSVEAADFAMRRCRQTKVDAYRVKS